MIVRSPLVSRCPNPRTGRCLISHVMRGGDGNLGMSRSILCAATNPKRAFICEPNSFRSVCSGVRETTPCARSQRIKKPSDIYAAYDARRRVFRDFDSDPDAPSVSEQIDSDLEAALEKIRSKLKPNDHGELDCLVDSVRAHYEELIIEKWKLLEEIRAEKK